MYHNLVISAQATSANVVFEGATSELDTQAYTPTITGFGTPTGVNITKRRSGDSIIIQGEFTSGTSTAVGATITLPSGYTVKGTANTLSVGSYFRSNATALSGGSMLATDGADHIALGGSATFSNTSTSALSESLGTNIAASGNRISFSIAVPVNELKASDIIMSVPVTNEVENVYSARIAAGATPSITSESAPFIQSVAQVSTGVYTVTFKSGFFTEIPSYAVTAENQGATTDPIIASVESISATSMEIRQAAGTGVASDEDLSLTLYRQGADYKNPKGYFLGNLSQPVGYLKDVKTSGTAGGTFTSGSYQTRTLNTTEGDFGLFGTLSSNQFSLSAGTYEIEASAPGFAVDAHKAIIYNITDAATELLGTSEFADNAGATAHSTISRISGEITITTNKTFEVRHRAQTTQATIGFGNASTFGDDELYSVVKIRKIK